MKNWREACLYEDNTIADAINSLNEVALRLVLVVTNDFIIKGTVTDGDIRRSLARGMTLETQLKQIMNTHPVCVSPDVSSREVKNIMYKNKIIHVPVINQIGKLIGLHLWDSLNKNYPHKIVVMAGGRGVRLSPLTDNCPKPMICVGGMPILEHILNHAKEEGFFHFIFSVHYKSDVIENYFADGEKFGVNIEYLREDIPLGTAGGLAGLKNSQIKMPIIVMNGDLLTKINYQKLLDFHEVNKATATMVTKLHEIKNQYGVVRSEGIDLAGFEEKPTMKFDINAGIYVLNPEVLEMIEDNKFQDMPSLLMMVKEKLGRVAVHKIDSEWVDVGRFEDLNMVRALFEVNQ